MHSEIQTDITQTPAGDGNWAEQFALHGRYSTTVAQAEYTRRMLTEVEDMVREISDFEQFSLADLEREDCFQISYSRASHFIAQFARDLGITSIDNSFLIRSSLFLIWVKVVDNYLDHQGGTAPFVLERLSFSRSLDRPPPARNSLEALTDCLAIEIGSRLDSFHSEAVLLAQQLETEKRSQTLSEYIAARKATGQQTAKLFLIATEDCIEFHSRFRNLVVEIAGVGNLIDSVFDLALDYKTGQVPFSPSLRNRMALTFPALNELVCLFVEYPELFREIPALTLRVPKWCTYSDPTNCDSINL